MEEQKRTKMSLNDRAKQFAPFDTLKGLKAKLKMVEYEHERYEKGDISEEKAKELSDILLNLNKKKTIKVTYFYDGHFINQEGHANLNIECHTLDINNKKIELDMIYDIEVMDNGEDF